jgi:hypothetical protein
MAASAQRAAAISHSAAAARFAVFRRNTTMLQSKTVFLLVAPPLRSEQTPEMRCLI